jgi:hypothetical protein
MAPSSDDRDRSFEKALARHFRNSAPPEASSATPFCVDMEALATYHEGGLAPEQRNLWKAHVEGCARCQGILAQLEATDAIPLDVAENSDKQKTVGLPVLLKPRRPAFWRWAAPAGALAAGLLVWIAVRENKPLQIAEVRKEVSSAPQARAPNPPEPVSKTESETVNPGEPKNPGAASVGAIVQQKRESNRAARRPTPTSREKNDANSADLYASASQQAEVGDRADAAANVLKEKVPVLLPSPVAPAPAPAPEASPKISAMSETVTVEAAPAARQKAKSATGNPSDQFALQKKQDLPLTSRGYDQLVTLAKSGGAVIIAAPSGPAQWRIGAAGIVEHSTDAGATWTLQSTGVVADLLAGSATSDKVCWIVGRAGTILRTTDGGAHWSKLPPPIVDDFASVFALNARHATVSPASGAYQTKDGGATWQKLAPE